MRSILSDAMLLRLKCANDPNHPQKKTDANSSLDGFAKQREASSSRTEESNAWIVEVLYRLGLLFMGLVNGYPSKTRERLLVSYFRYKGTANVENIKTICLLCRATENHKSLWSRQGQVKMEEYFGRFPIPNDVIQRAIRWIERGHHTEAGMFIGGSNFDPVTWSSKLFVLLYFAPALLESEVDRMKRLVEHFYHDNWVLSYSLGETVDICVAWAPYKAATAALNGTLSPGKAKKLASMHSRAIENLQRQMNAFLGSDSYFDDCALTGMKTMLDVQHSAHTSLRWIVLHSMFTLQKKISEAVRSCCPDAKAVFNLLLVTSKFEWKIAQACTQLGEKRQTALAFSLGQANQLICTLLELIHASESLYDAEDYHEAITQLGSVQKELVRVKKPEDVDLAVFQLALDQMQELEWSNQYFLQNNHMSHYLAEACTHVIRIIKITGTSESEITAIHPCENTFLWAAFLGKPGRHESTYLTASSTDCLKDPSVVADIAILFLKLKAGMDDFLWGGIVGEGASSSAENLYASTLLSYITEVIQGVSSTIFRVVSDLLVFEYNWMHTSSAAEAKSSPVIRRERCTRRKLRGRAFREICRFTHAIQCMKSILAGNLAVQPESILDASFRRHLSASLQRLCEEVLLFKKNSGVLLQPGQHDEALKGSSVKQRLQLEELGDFLGLYEKLLEDLQDFIPLPCMHIWREEYDRVLTSATSSVINSHVTNSDLGIPDFSGSKVNFMGRLVHYIQRVSHPAHSMFLRPLCGWYGPSGEELLGITFFTQLKECMGQVCLLSLESVLDASVKRQMKEALNCCMTHVQQNPALESSISELSAGITRFKRQTWIPGRHLLSLNENVLREHGSFLRMLGDHLAFIGQNQLLRRRLASGNCVAAEFENKVLVDAISTASMSLDRFPKAEDYFRVLRQSGIDRIGDEWTGLESTLKFYCRRSGQFDYMALGLQKDTSTSGMSAIMYLLTLFVLPCYVFDSHLCCLVRKRGRHVVDCAPLIFGIATVLKSISGQETELYISHMTHFIRSHLIFDAEEVDHAMRSSLLSSGISGATEIADVYKSAPAQATSALFWIVEFSKVCEVPDLMLQDFLPSFARGNIL